MFVVNKIMSEILQNHTSKNIALIVTVCTGTLIVIAFVMRRDIKFGPKDLHLHTLDPFRYSYHNGRVALFQTDVKYHFYSQITVQARHTLKSDYKQYIVFSVQNAHIFQHFFQDLLYCIYAHKDIIRNTECVVVVPNWKHAVFMLRYLGITNKIVTIKKGLTLYGNVTLVQWRPYGEEGDEQWQVINKSMFQWRRHLFTYLQPTWPSDSQLLILVKRTGIREWDPITLSELEPQLRNYCKVKGLEFVTFEPKGDSEVEMKERIQMFNKAVCVIGIHGGANYHVYFCPRGSTFIEVTTPGVFWCGHFGWWIDAAYIKYKRIVASTGAHNTGESVTVHVPTILRSLE